MKYKRSHLLIGSYNINGLKNNFEAVHQLISAEALDILAIQETKVAKTYSFPPGRQYEAASIRRGKHGLALSIAPDIKYTRLFDINHEGGQALAIKIENLTIINIYASPSSRKKTFVSFLEAVNREVKGRTIILGDWNPRHPSWGEGTNPKGPQLFHWINKYDWVVYAPESPTHHAVMPEGRTVATTIDFAIARMGPIDSIHAKDGTWDGASDHKPVLLRAACQRNKLHRKRRISVRRRTKEELIEKFIELIPAKAADIINTISAATTQEELDMAYWQLVHTLILPFKPKGKIPSIRARYFWTNELERMTKQRSRIYRRYTYTGNQGDYARCRK